MTSLATPAPSNSFPAAPSQQSPIFVTEPVISARRPLIALADRSRRPEEVSGCQNVSEGGSSFRYLCDSSGATRWKLQSPDWCITSPKLPPSDGRVASFGSVMDIYVALLARHQAATTNGTLEFTRADLIREMGWMDGSKRKAPSGEHNTRLALALDYLREVDIDSLAVRMQLERITGQRIARANVSILSSVLMRRTRRGEVSYEIRFNPLFASLLEARDGPVARYELGAYLALPSGVPRALFRLLHGLRAEHGDSIVSIPADDVLASLGSSRRGIELSRMKEILEAPHRLMFAGGHLATPAEWKKSSAGAWIIEYSLGTPPGLRDLLEQSLLVFGVKPHWAKSWSIDTRRATELLAAAVRGSLTPTGTLGTMFHYYFTRPDQQIDVAAMPAFVASEGTFPAEPRSDQFAFLREVHDSARRWLATRPDIHRVLRGRYARHFNHDWMTEGLVLLAAHQLWGGPDVTGRFPPAP